MIYKENSDITKVKSGIIAHGVNCQGAMGSGVAKALCEKWPEIKTKYLKDYKIYRPELGEIKRIDINKKLLVFNCYTQEYYGYNNETYANLYSILFSLSIIVENYNPKQINIPKIGCGLGGLHWDNVEEKLLRLEKKYKMEFVVHTL